MSEMPYGGVMNTSLGKGRSVLDRSVHRGYYHMVAWCVHMQSFAPYIEDRCREAAELGAPMDALYLRGTDRDPMEEREWSTFEALREANPEAWADIEAYVAAMKRREKERSHA